MAVTVKHAFVCTIFILSYGQLIAEDDTDTRIADLETLAAKVEFSAYKNAGQLDNLKLRVQELQDGTKMDGIKVRQVADPNIGFDARVVALKPHYVDQQTIVFNRIQVNQGGGYSNTSGRFTCPQHGLYQFAATIPSQLNGTIECEMVMDNVQIGLFMANEPGFDQATQVVVLECGVEQQPAASSRASTASWTGTLRGSSITSSSSCFQQTAFINSCNGYATFNFGILFGVFF